MNDESGRVDGIGAFDAAASMVAADEVRDLDLAEMHPERVHPERIGELGVARGDVTGDALVETEFREQAEAGRQSLLAVKPLFRSGGELRRHRHFRGHRPLIDRVPGLDVHDVSSPGQFGSSLIVRPNYRLVTTASITQSSRTPKLA